MDLTGQELCKAIACRIRPAGTVPKVAYCQDPLLPMPPPHADTWFPVTVLLLTASDPEL